MRVLMLGWELPPLISGGLGIACHGLLTALGREGVDVQFVVPWAVQGLECDSVKVVGAFGNVQPSRVPRHVSVSSLLSYTTSYGGELYNQNIHREVERYAEIAGRIAREQVFDIVHAHDWTTCKAGILAKETLGKPLVVHFHSIEHDRSPGIPNPQVCALEGEGLRAANHVITVSSYTRQQIAENYRLAPGRTEVIHNGIDEIVHFSPRLSLSERWPKTALFVGRLTAQKGPQYFLSAAERVLRSAPDTRFIIVGDGDMRSYLEQLAKELRITDRVLFTGFLSRFDLERVYTLANVCVSTSVSEPFGLVALEAMKHRVPVIVPRHAGVTEVVRHCVQIEYWDVDGIADAILDILSNHDSLAEELSRNAAQEVRKLTWERAARKVIGVYQGLSAPSQC